MTDGDGVDDDVPLDIVGHESRRRERAAENGESAANGETATNGESAANGDSANGDSATNGESANDESADGEAVQNGDAPADGGDSENGDGGLITEFEVDDEADDDEVEPVELLVQLAEDGEIDPWDIDIVAVTDKFLERLDDADLRTGGRALFYASVLLRMKSDHLLDDDEPEDEELEAWDAPLDDPAFDGPAVDPFDQLESEMERRLERKRARGMPQTLDELVRDLRERERGTWWKEHREYDTSGSPKGYSRGTQTLDYHTADDLRLDDEPTEADVTGTAHDEHLEDVITEVYMQLREHYDAGRDEVLYAELVAGAPVAERVETFLALLFLAHRSQVQLQQDDLFGDLWVQDPAAVPGPEEAVADAD